MRGAKKLMTFRDVGCNRGKDNWRRLLWGKNNYLWGVTFFTIPYIGMLDPLGVLNMSACCTTFAYSSFQLIVYKRLTMTKNDLLLHFDKNSNAFGHSF